MKNRKLIWRSGIAIIFLLCVFVLAGGWWMARGRASIPNGAPDSAVFVFILSPTHGGEFNAGDFVPVNGKVIAPQNIVRAEFFVNGEVIR